VQRHGVVNAGPDDLQGAKSLMQRASEKAADSLEAKRAAQQAPVS
jgi:hypothetical protein